MVKGFRKLIEKIKFKFKGTNNQEFVFESNIEIPVGKNEVEIIEENIDKKYIDAVELANIEVEHKKFDLNIKRLSKIERYYVYTTIVEKDKLNLVRILLRTRKPRVRKKLVKRLDLK